MWSPQSSLSSSTYFLSPLSPYDQHHILGNKNNNIAGALPAPLLSSSPVNNRRRRTHSLMDNSLDLVVDGDSTANFEGPVNNSDCDSGYFQNAHFNPSYSQRHAGTYNHSHQQPMSRNVAQFILSPVESDGNSYTSPNNAEILGGFTSLSQFLHYRTELLVSGQQATAWNHYTIVSQLRKLENLNLIDRSLIKRDNPPIEILTLVQKLVKYNLAMEIIDNEDEQLRQEQLTKLIKLRCEEVLAMSNAITEITERRQAIYNERCRIRLAMKELAAEITAKTRKDVDEGIANESSEKKTTCPPPLLQNKPLICL